MLEDFQYASDIFSEKTLTKEVFHFQDSVKIKVEEAALWCCSKNLENSLRRHCVRSFFTEKLQAVYF